MGLVQGGIHSGEIDGKDAGFLALRQMLDGEAAKGALDKFVLLFVAIEPCLMTLSWLT